MASILAVCTGNVCRSPLAEGFLRVALDARSAGTPIDVTSAGTMGWDGSGADPLSVRAGTERGIDISSHIARVTTPKGLRDAALVVGMALEHVEMVTRQVPAVAGRSFTLKELVRLLEALPAPAPGKREALLMTRVSQADALRRSGFEGDPHDEDIADPLGMPLEAFRGVAVELDEWCARLADGLLGRAPARTSTSDED